MINCSPNFLTQVKFSPNNIITYNLYVGDGSRNYSDRSRENLCLSKEKKDMSKKAVRRLLRAMDWLLLISQEKHAMNLKKGKLFKYKLSLVTLTLPSLQAHSDNYIKKYCLNELLTVLRKEYNLQNYLWKAEKQFNGNIHFHLVIDKYIYFKDLNRIWNKILGNHGYIDEYRRNQQDFHADGFRVRTELTQWWSEKAQLKAFKEGYNTNWTNPTSSTDIHSLRKISNARAYLAKYISKNPDVNRAINYESKKYKTENNTTSVPDTILADIRSRISGKLHVDGNLWYISRSLSKLNGVTSDLTDGIRSELEEIEQKYPDKILTLDHCRVYKFNIFQLFKMKMLNCFEQLKNYCLEVRQLFYPPGTQEKYALGIPLPIFDNYGK